MKIEIIESSIENCECLINDEIKINIPIMVIKIGSKEIVNYIAKEKNLYLKEEELMMIFK